jgi:LL-H family phage holin
MDSTFTSQLATALVIAMVPVIVGGLGYLARSVIAFVKAKTSAEQYAMLEKLAAQAVLAAEQTMKNSAGAKKLEAAKAVVTNALLKRGIVIDEQQVIAAIEAAVYTETLKVDFYGVDQGVSPAASLPEIAPAESAADGPVVA